MMDYEDWSLAGWRTHLPGVADVRHYVAGLGDETIPALAAAAADRVPDRIALTADGDLSLSSSPMPAQPPSAAHIPGDVNRTL